MFPEDALLKAVIAEPEDDSPRLMYADWLDENGQEARAEFIRVQVALARMKKVESREYRELHTRAEELLSAYGNLWEGPFRGCGGKRHFVRGFIRESTCDLPAFVYHAEALFAHSPLQDITLHHARGGLVELSSVRQLIRVHTLWLFSERLDDDDARALSRCPYLKCLNHLSLADNAISDGGARALASSPYLDSLDYLDLSDNPTLTSPGRAALRRRFRERVRF